MKKNVKQKQKFGFSGEIISYLLSAIEKYGILVELCPSGIMLPDGKNLPFYEVVLEKREDDACLVTGNIRHFPKEPFIVTPRELLDILSGGG